MNSLIKQPLCSTPICSKKTPSVSISLCLSLFYFPHLFQLSFIYRVCSCFRFAVVVQIVLLCTVSPADCTWRTQWP